MLVRKLTQEIYREGLLFLRQADPDLNQVILQYGDPPVWGRQPGYATLVKIILEQQVSLASAQAAYDRLQAELGEITPQGFLTLSDERLKEIGFSRQKTRYGRILAGHVLEGALDLEGLQVLEDDEVRARLTAITGIGPWTADIYLLMALLRPDVWPQGDLALATAMQQVKGLPERPAYPQMHKIALAWKPWRALAARILWHHYLNQ